MKKVVFIAAALAVGYVGYQHFMGTKAVQVDVSAQQAKINQYANPQAFVTPQALAELMKNGNTVVIGTLDPKRADKPISGSFTVWRNDYSADKSEFPYGGIQASKAKMEALLSKFGATPDSTIVVYSSGAHHDSARLYWQLKELGHKDVRILDGGLNVWVGAGLPTGDANPTVTASNYVAPDYQLRNYADMKQVIAATKDTKDWLIIDTRDDAEFNGEKVVDGAFGAGSIPNSIHINWTNAVNKDTTLKSVDELKAIYADKVAGKKVIPFCQSGVRSAHTEVVLKEILGVQDVYNYDGSWIEWSYNHYEAKNPEVSVSNVKG